MNKKLQELKEQLVQLQTTIEEYEKTLCQPAELNQPWEPQGGEWHVFSDGDVTDLDTHSLIHRLFGTLYKTKTQAEWARDHMRRFNRLLAYVAEFDVNENGVQWKPDWNDPCKSKYTIVYDHSSKFWIPISYTIYESMPVYMSKQCAENLIKKLNSGEVTL